MSLRSDILGSGHEISLSIKDTFLKKLVVNSIYRLIDKFHLDLFQVVPSVFKNPKVLLLIQASIKSNTVSGGEVTEYPAFEVHIFSQIGIEKALVLASVGSIDSVVSTHEGTYSSINRTLKGLVIHLII